MKNLNVLTNETKNQIIAEMDLELTNQQMYIDFLIEEHRKELKTMTSKRDYWRAKFNELNELNKPARKPRTVVKEVTINTRKTPKEFTPGTSEDSNYRPGNFKNTKHDNGHFSKKSGEVLVGTRVSDGEIFEFDSKQEAIDYLKGLAYKGKFTNLSRAARGNSFYATNGGKAYGHFWKYETKVAE